MSRNTKREENFVVNCIVQYQAFLLLAWHKYILFLFTAHYSNTSDTRSILIALPVASSISITAP